MDGKWSGRTVVSASQIEKLVRGCDCSSGFDRAAGSSFDVGKKSADHYGMLVWNNRNGAGLGGGVPSDAFYMRGLQENLVVVVPSRKLIVVRLGDGPTFKQDFKNQLMSRVMDALAG
jgi:CubicO group peptidase (beta-lactamase class C family)